MFMDFVSNIWLIYQAISNPAIKTTVKPFKLRLRKCSLIVMLLLKGSKSGFTLFQVSLCCCTQNHSPNQPAEVYIPEDVDWAHELNVITFCFIPHGFILKTTIYHFFSPENVLDLISSWILPQWGLHWQRNTHFCSLFELDIEDL